MFLYNTYSSFKLPGHCSGRTHLPLCFVRRYPGLHSHPTGSHNFKQWAALGASHVDGHGSGQSFTTALGSPLQLFSENILSPWLVEKSTF